MQPHDPHGAPQPPYGPPERSGQAAPYARTAPYVQAPLGGHAWPPVAAPSPPSDVRAVLALVLGVLSVTCLGLFAGIPAIVLGAMSRKEIDRSQGRLAGRGLAAGGIVAGLFGTGLSLVVAVALVSGVLEAAHPREARTASARGVPVAAGTHSYGSLEVVDLDANVALEPQLRALAKASAAKGRTVILQTYVRSSRECADVAAALPDPRMQRALENVTLVRVDIEAFESALTAMRVDTDAVPWFYKLDSTANVTDAISADEWDANVPENMAPVLADFARGILSGRRSPSPAGTAL